METGDRELRIKQLALVILACFSPVVFQMSALLLWLQSLRSRRVEEKERVTLFEAELMHAGIELFLLKPLWVDVTYLRFWFLKSVLCHVPQLHQSLRNKSFQFVFKISGYEQVNENRRTEKHAAAQTCPCLDKKTPTPFMKDNKMLACEFLALKHSKENEMRSWRHEGNYLMEPSQRDGQVWNYKKRKSPGFFKFQPCKISSQNN